MSEFTSKVMDCFKENGHVNMRLMNYMLEHGVFYVTFYNKQLRSEKALDFNDLITMTKILFNDETVVEYYREKYRVLNQKSYELRPFEMILEIQKHFDIMNKYPEVEREERFKRVKQFYKVLSILDDEYKAPRDALISVNELTALSTGEIEQIISSAQEKPRIPIITVHQAKGLEFDTVVVSGLVEGKFPIYKGDLDEEGKLFYVAITRAKKRLVLTYPNSGMSNSGYQYSTQESPFIGKINNEYLDFK